MSVVAYVPDLMDRSKLAAAASSSELRFVDRPGDLAAAALGAELVVVDLARPGISEVLAEVTAVARVVGFGSHVDRTTLERAQAAGCEAMPRSQFLRSLAEVLNP